MRSGTNYVWLGLAMVVLAGCLESKTVLTVRKDGSGTIEQVAYYKPVQLPIEGAPKPPLGDEFARLQEGCAKAAQAMGEGVTVQSVTALQPRGEWRGVRVVYAFADLNKVHLAAAPPVGGFQSDSGHMRFQFSQGDWPHVTVIMPPIELPRQKQDQPGPQLAPEGPMMAMMAQMLDGFRIEFLLKVDGTIRNTNAMYVNRARNTVGLFQQNIGAMLKDPAVLEKLKNLEKVQDATVVKEKLQDEDIRKYIKFDPAEKVEIDFQ